MITNERQYRIAQSEIQRFEAARSRNRRQRSEKRPSLRGPNGPLPARATHQSIEPCDARNSLSGEITSLSVRMPAVWASSGLFSRNGSVQSQWRFPRHECLFWPDCSHEAFLTGRHKPNVFLKKLSIHEQSRPLAAPLGGATNRGVRARHDGELTHTMPIDRS